MKKLNKIIPLACLATTLPSVAPLLASCAQETKYVFDLTDTGYDQKPSRVAWDGQALNPESATKLYYEMVTNDPKQFIYDYMFGRNKFIHSVANEKHARIKSFVLSSTLPKFGTTTCSFSHEPDMTYPTASFTIEGHLEIVLDLDSENATENKMDLVIDSKVTYKDCIFYAYADESRGVANAWTVGMMDLSANATDGSGTCIAYLYNNDPWSIDVDYNCDATTTYYDPETGTHTTSTQNYNFKRKLEDYYSLNDVLELTYGYRGGNLDTFPIGFLWYLIPMDFASEAFRDEGGGSITKEITVGFQKSTDWTFTYVRGSEEDENPQLVATFPSALYITGLPSGFDEKNITISAQDKEGNALVLQSLSKESIGKVRVKGENLEFDVTKPASWKEGDPNEYWDMKITWTVPYDASDKTGDWAILKKYFVDGAGMVKTTVPYKLLEGYVTASIEIGGEEVSPDIQDDFFWATPNLEFGKVVWPEEQP